MQHGHHTDEAVRRTEVVAEATSGTTTSGSEDEETRAVRERAARLLEDLPEAEAVALAGLLDVAYREYCLVVMLARSDDQQYLTYQAPLVPHARWPKLRRRPLRGWLPFSTEYTFSYETQIPRAVASYHVTVEVPEEIDVRRFLLSTDADAPAVEALCTRLDALADVVQDSGRDAVERPSTALLRLELEEVLAEVRALGRRRMLDRSDYMSYLAYKRIAPAPGAVGRALRRHTRRNELLGDAPSIAGLHLPGDLTVAADRGLRLGEQLPSSLRALSTFLRARSYGADVSSDNDPREHGAHAQWRQRDVGFGRRTHEPVRAQVYLAIADEPPALISSVARILFALLAVVVGVHVAAVFDGPLWGPEDWRGVSWDLLRGRTAAEEWLVNVGDRADAVVAVLLIVPGILLSRLDIPRTHSVLGVLRRFPVRVAFASVITTTVLAMVVAARPQDVTAAFLWSELALVVLLAVCAVEATARAWRHRQLVPAVGVIPGWLRDEFSRGPAAALRLRARPLLAHGPARLVQHVLRALGGRAPDITFDATGGNGDRGRGPALTLTISRSAEMADAALRLVGGASNALHCSLVHDAGGHPVSVAGDALGAPTLDGSRREDPCAGPPAHPSELLYVSDGHVSFQASATPVAVTEVLAETALTDCTPPNEALGPAWYRHARLNALVLRPESQDVDYLLCRASTGAGLHPADSRQLLRLLRTLLESLTDANASTVGGSPGAPVLPTVVSMPAAPPATTEADRRRPATGACLRLSFSAPAADNARRLAVEDRLVRSAEGFEVWRARQTPGSGQGDWRQLVPDSSSPDGAAPSLVGSRRDRTTTTAPVLPVTIVGPAGPDSTRLLTSICRLLERAALTCTSLTATPLGQLVVVHIGAVAEHWTGDEPPQVASGVCSVGEGLARLQRVGVLSDAADAGAESVSGLEDFRICLGGAAGWEPGVVASPPGDRPEVGLALWLTWQAPHGLLTDAEIASHLRREAVPLVGATTILVWRSRRMPDGLVHGRSKLAVTKAAAANGLTAGEQAKALQQAVLDRMRRAAGPSALSVAVHVTWSEDWLERRRGL